MSTTDPANISVKNAILAAWKWATFMADGCYPQQCYDSVNLARIAGFAAGRLGVTGWRELRDSVPRHRIDQITDAEVPTEFTWDDLLRVVLANDPEEQDRQRKDRQPMTPDDEYIDEDEVVLYDEDHGLDIAMLSRGEKAWLAALFIFVAVLLLLIIWPRG